MTPEQQGLAASYIPLARRLASPLKRAWPALADDFDSAALTALVEAAQSFDPARNVKFATFLRYRVRGALRDAMRDLAPGGFRRREPIVMSLFPHAEERGTVVGAAPARPVGEEFESRDWVARMCRKLPARHREVVELLYLEGLDQQQTAAQVHLSASRVSLIHKEALEILRHALEDEARPPRMSWSQTLYVARHAHRRPMPR